MGLLEITQLLHNIGIAWGVGGATIALILMIKSEKNPEIAPQIMKVMPAISKLIWIAIIFLIVSGIALTKLISWPIDLTVLAVKHIVVVILVLNGINLSFRILPKMERLVPKDEKPSEDFLKVRKNAKIAGIIGIASWYLILVLSVIM